MKKFLVCFLLFFSFSSFYGQDQFIERTIIDQSSSVMVPKDVLSIDLDGDGDQDVVTASYDDHKIAWYENEDSQGTFGAQKIISKEATNALSIFAIDLDGDGDNDILSASEGNNTIAWYENLNGLGTFSDTKIISSQAQGAKMVLAKDLDGDGDIDVISASSEDDKIAWYDNTDGNGTFGTEKIISAVVKGVNSIYISDIDNDGDFDILSTNNGAAEFINGTVVYNKNITWYNNLDGFGNFGDPIFIEQFNSEAPVQIKTADIDNDGDQDVIASTSRSLKRYENSDGQGTFIELSKLSRDQGIRFQLTDFNKDGFIDIVRFDQTNELGWSGLANAGFSYQKISNHVNGTFGLSIPEAINVGDINNDGYPDILLASSGHDKITSFKYQPATNDFGKQFYINRNAKYVGQVRMGDIDGDGDLDMASVGGADGKVAWYENTDGHGLFGLQKLISTDLDAGDDIDIKDVDGDGDLDILAVGNAHSSTPNNAMGWFENIDGKGTFKEELHKVRLVMQSPFIIGVDIDGDSDIDIVSSQRTSSTGNHGILWFENKDGQGTFKEIGAWEAEGNSIVSAHNLSDVKHGDFDQDGDIDILYASSDQISWSENINGQGDFSSKHIIDDSSDSAKRIHIADLDGDGDLDIVSLIGKYLRPDIVNWYENSDGLGTFEGPKTIDSFTEHLASITTLDVDGDGDLDVLSSSTIENEIYWYENFNGNGAFTSPNVLSNSRGASFLMSKDVNDDGHNEIITVLNSEDRISYFQNLRLLNPNDVDGDGIENDIDNCPETANPNQEDINNNTIGDACENLENPFLVVSDQINTCPLDGGETPIINSCTIGDSRLVTVNNISYIDSIAWEKLDESSCTVIDKNCINQNSSCFWETISNATSFSMTESGEYRVSLFYSNGIIERFFTKAYFNGIFAEATVIKNLSIPGVDDAEILMNVIQGNGPFEYQIEKLGVQIRPWQNSPLFSDLGPGNYTAHVRNSAGCSKLVDVNIGDAPEQLSISAISTYPTCSRFATPSIETTVNNGTAPYTYQLYDAGSNTLIKSIAAVYENDYIFRFLSLNTYYVVVTDRNSNQVQSSNVLVEAHPNPLLLDINITYGTCYENNTSEVTLIASGGTGPYEYSIDEGVNYQSNNVFTNLAEGNHRPVIKDATGCTNNSFFTIDYTAIVADVQLKNVSCTGNNDGSIAIIAEGGVSPLSYSIGGSLFSAQPNFYNLAIGDYDITVQDANGCFITTTANISKETCETTLLDVQSILITPISCSGDNDASIEVIVTGGSAPYSYELYDAVTYAPITSTSAVNTTNYNFNNLAPGNYLVVLTDSNSNQAQSNSITITETEPLDATISVTNIACFGSNDTRVIFETQGGAGQYEYSTDGGVTFQSSNIFENLTLGTYLGVVRDLNGCFVYLTFYVSEGINIEPEIDVTHVSCNNTDGSITINIANPGEYLFSIDDNADLTNFSLTNEFTGLESGTYTVSIAHIAGCIKEEVVIIESEDCPDFSLAANNFTIETTSESCASSDNGNILISVEENHDYTATLIGGTVTESKKFITLTNFSDLEAGSYELCITVAGEADYEKCFTIQIAEPDDLGVSSKIDLSAKTVSLSLKGSSRYFISVNGTEYSTSEDEISLPLSKVENNITVRTDKECQGVYEEMLLATYDSVSIFPNPVEKGNVTILLPTNSIDEEALLTLFSQNGIRVLEKIEKSDGRTLKINMDALPPGIYTIIITTESQNSMRKIIKK